MEAGGAAEEETLPQAVIDQLEAEAAQNWDKFYKVNADRFFKDRHYLDAEFEQLRPPAEGASPAARTFAEVGCGAGNTVLPLLELHPRATVYACDYSPRAVELTQQRAAAAGVADRLRAFVCDVTRQPLQPQIPKRSCDVITLIFALSAMSPETMPAAVAACAASLAPGGSVLVRDYAAGDLAETRLAERGAAAGAASQKLGDSFYVRGDGTRSYYFAEDTLRALFAQQGLACVQLGVQERDITNRAQGVTMRRRWIQAVFTRDSGSGGGGDDASDAAGGDGAEHIGEAEGVAATGGDLVSLFGGGTSSGDGAEVRLTSAGRELTLQLLGREHQHTERATGAMLWEGSRALSEHLAARPHLVASRRVVELGAGAAALPSMAAAAAGASAVAATDGHPGVLRMLTANLARNGAAECVPARRLRWGHAGDCAAVRAGSPYDVALAADVVYDAAALPQLFATARQLLRGAPAAALLLCHVSDRGGVSHAALERAAAAAGITLREEPLAPEALAAAQGAPCRLVLGTLMEAGKACNAA